VANDEYGGFQIVVALYWWLSGIVSGFIFIGLSEIIHLLQRLLDANRGASQPFQAAEPFASSSAVGNVGMAVGDAETRIKDLTIVMHGDKFKGQFWITDTEVRVMRKAMFRSEAEAQLVKVISKSKLAPNYERILKLLNAL